jgi:hypothetical protein
VSLPCCVVCSQKIGVFEPQWVSRAGDVLIQLMP